MPARSKATKRRRDPLPPVHVVREGEHWDPARGRFVRSRSFPAQLGAALVRKAGEPVVYDDAARPVPALKQYFLEIRAAANAALRLLKSLEGK